MPHALARALLAVSVALAGAGVATGAMLPWITTYAGLTSFAAVEGLFGQLLVALGGLVVLSGALLLWRETAVGRWLLLLAALGAVLLGAWVLVQAESAYATLAADPFTVAGRGPGGWLCLGSAVLALVLALVRLPARETVGPDPGVGTGASQAHTLSR